MSNDRSYALTVQDFLSRYQAYNDGLVLVLDRDKSNATTLHCAIPPLSCSATWFDVPTASVDTIEHIGNDTCCGKAFHVVFVRTKSEFKSLERLFTMTGSRNRQAAPLKSLDSSALKPSSLLKASPSVRSSGELEFVFNDVFRVGDCALQAGHRFIARADGTLSFRGYVQSSDTNDSFTLVAHLYDHEQTQISYVWFYYNMNGDSCTSPRWCYWEEGRTFDASLFSKLGYIGYAGRC